MRLASVLLICSIALCSACAVTAPPAPAPVVVKAQHCARPAPPALPQVSGTVTMDAPEQLAGLVNRDTLMRRYIAGLRDALDCYDKQTKGATRD